ncbi:hypothetical protein J3Q64DRAFT_1737466 [Phycomyces blakesleeanus]|uniref:Uncharacterized protein n=2 Tax=Phycomyces blakesleeanus TaxID=4837 RepID=A0A167LQ90_PHYB8|nr:hypothetical protein PHYBLDRAFT_148110 [Phycomyces blakesleeanus NRRL 1555(-)]OAD70889.1 hypothetical protein PHYBLDRAFT_148110 [Phycomyces blakesleeanus NRRL 1555(-)]|eukprot:XP_018288929.1 hypothetical protein PHYBLDRAFT_148110 [Phycomyces blakesleeanus NRRL 1555(-)]
MTDAVETMEIDSILEEDLLGTDLDNAIQDDLNLVESTEKTHPEQDLSTLDTTRQEAIFLQGVDEMSTEDIWEYCSGLPLSKVEWIDDSHCNLVFSSEEEAIKAAHDLVSFPLAEDETLSTTRLRKAKIYTRSKDGENFESLQIRCATMDDIKIQGAGNYSRYYLLHGTDSSIRRQQQQQRSTSSNKRTAPVRKTDEEGNPLPITSRLGERRTDQPQRERVDRRTEYRDVRGEGRRRERRERGVGGESVLSRLGARISSNTGPDDNDRYPAWQRRQRSSRRRRSMSPVRSTEPDGDSTAEKGLDCLSESLRGRLGTKKTS